MTTYILAGSLKGRRLMEPPEGANTRPITGLAKKSLFDILGGLLDGAAVADLYCGTGTMGLEAISRGATSCRFAELDRAVVERLQRNIRDMHVESCSTVWSGDVTARLADWLKQESNKLDVAFVDPPYADARAWDWQTIIEKIFQPLAENLTAGGIVVLRTPEDVAVPDPLGPLAQKRVKTYGQMKITLFGKTSQAE